MALTYLSPEAFEQAATRLFGPQYQSACARAIGRSRSQVFRYARGDAPIPKDVALIVLLLTERLDAGLTPPALLPAGDLTDGKFTPAII
jgi:hypothetical protein